MTSDRPKNPQEQWQALLEVSEDEFVRELDAMNPAELDALSRSQGIDPDALEKRLRDALDRACAQAEAEARVDAQPAPPSSTSGPELAHAVDVSPPSSQATSRSAPRLRGLLHLPRRYSAYAVALAAVIAFSVIHVLGVLGKKEQPVPPPPDPSAPQLAPPAPSPPAPQPKPDAKSERAEAARACAAKDWQACQDHLDTARQLDPDGERDLGVRELRAKATAGLNGKGPGK
jgi:hypothetical protein